MSQFQLKHVLAQVENAKGELCGHPPNDVDWYEHATETCKEFVPFLFENALGLQNYVDGVMNSPLVLREELTRLFEITDKSSLGRNKKFKTLKESVEKAAELEKLLLAQAGGTTVSKLIENYLIAKSGKLELLSNGSSDYPDLYSAAKDYSRLPVFRRGRDQV